MAARLVGELNVVLVRITGHRERKVIFICMQKKDKSAGRNQCCGSEIIVSDPDPLFRKFCLDSDPISDPT